MSDEKDDNVPNTFLCPIGHTVMVDPVMTEDGHSYDRQFIEQW